MSKFKHHLAFLIYGILGITFGVFAVISLVSFGQSVWRAPGNPDWSSFSGFGFMIGMANAFILICVFLWLTRRYTALTKLAENPKKGIILKRKLIYLAVSLGFFWILWPVQDVVLGVALLHIEIRPGFFSAQSNSSIDPIRRWLEAIPCLMGNLFMYLALTYPFSFKWPISRIKNYTRSNAINSSKLLT